VRAVETCERWWSEPTGNWRDSVIPRVLAAHIRRDHGDLGGAKALLEAAIEEEERIKIAERENAEKGSKYAPGAIGLWKPAFTDLISVAEALHDDELADGCRAKMAAVHMKPFPASAESYLDDDLAGLRQIDVNRGFRPLSQPKQKVQ